MPQLTRPGVKTDQGTRYFNNPAQAAQALAQAMTQYVQPSTAVLPDAIDTPVLPPEPASKLGALQQVLGMPGLAAAGAEVRAAARRNTFRADTPSGAMPEVVHPSFRSTVFDQTGNVRPLQGGDANPTTLPGSLLRILFGAGRGAADAIASGALDAPQNGQSPFGAGVRGAMLMPQARQQQYQANQRAQLQNEQLQQEAQGLPILRLLGIQKTQAEINNQNAQAEKAVRPPNDQYVSNGAGIFRSGPNGELTLQPGTTPPVKPDSSVTPYEDFRSGYPDTPQGRKQAAIDYAKTSRPVNQAAADAKDQARADKSYQYHSGLLDKAQQPISDAVGRLGRLQDTLSQGTPQADALVAPELLTVMAGGQGSGLRMNEAEISRIVGGRSKWQSLQASINKWKTDPNAARSITPEQQQQIQALVGVVNGKLQAKQRILDDARQALINSSDPMEHRRILAAAKSKLSAIDQGSNVSGVSNGPPRGYVRIQASDGNLHDLPAANLDKARQRDPGLKVVQ